jgi:hypothetical protein
MRQRGAAWERVARGMRHNSCASAQDGLAACDQIGDDFAGPTRTWNRRPDLPPNAPHGARSSTGPWPATPLAPRELAMAEQKKIPITKKQLEQRIYAHLKLNGQRFHRTTGGELQITNMHGDVVVKNVDYDALVHDLGVVRPWEELEQ